MSQLRDDGPILADADWARRPAAAACAVLLGWLVIGSLWPFIPVGSFGEWWQQTRYAISWRIGEPALNTLVERCITLIPLGFLVCRTLAGRQPARAARQAALFIAAVVAVLEFLQTGVIARHARLTDAVLGFIAGVIGIRLAILARNRPPEWLGRIRKSGERMATVGVVAANFAICAAIVVFHWGTRLDNWDRAFPLVVANEASRDRPWVGRIYGFAVYPRALGPADVARISALPFDDASLAERVAHEPLAIYHFGSGVGDGGLVRPCAGTLGPALKLWGQRDSYRITDNCLEFLKPAAVMTEGPAPEITDALVAAGEFSLEALFEPADLRLKGPARIISLSADPENRNFTLAQVQSSLVFRLRTPTMGVNGTNMPFGTRDGTLGPRSCHAFVTYVNGTLRLYVDGREPWRPLHLYWPSNLIMRGTWSAGGIVLAAMLFTPMGMVAGYRIRRIPSRAVTAGAAIAVVLLPILTSVGLTAAYQRVFELRFLVAIAVFGTLGVKLGRRIRDHGTVCD